MSEYKAFNSIAMRDNPCKRDCPDRQPGCNCERRKAWREWYEALKEEQYHNRVKAAVVESVLADGKKGRRH